MSQAPAQSRPVPTAFRDRNMEEQHRINNAVMMQGENELLVWKSLDRNESIPQTKLHYERDMLLIDSDDQDDEDDDSGNSGSVEWQEDHAWEADDHARMQRGVIYGPQGWYHPDHHKSAEDRINQERERRSAAASTQGSVQAGGASSSQQGTPRNRRARTSGQGFGSPGTPGRSRTSGGKRALGPNGATQG